MLNENTPTHEPGVEGGGEREAQAPDTTSKMGENRKERQLYMCEVKGGAGRENGETEDERKETGKGARKAVKAKEQRQRQTDT